MKIEGNIVDVINKSIYPAEIEIKGNRIKSIQQNNKTSDKFILPGFIDSHIHIESSMLSPVEFSKQAIQNGTIAAICDPHEIANVCGLEGIDYMIRNSENTPMKIFFGAPSCVPATEFETSGYRISSSDVKELLTRDDIYFLSEMMNFPGVIYNDKEVHLKLSHARNIGKPIDGHAPGLRGESLQKYIQSGITTDHECFYLEEAIEKIGKGMKILIREGSAAKNLDALMPLIDEFSDKIMFCSDDIHPDELIGKQINNQIKKSISKGYNLFNILNAATVNPVIHYNLPVGLLRLGDYADFIVVKDLIDFKLLQMYIDGELIYDSQTDGIRKKYFKSDQTKINKFNASKIGIEDLKIEPDKKVNYINIIEVIDGELITKSNKILFNTNNLDKFIESNKLTKIVLINRYEKKCKPVLGLLRNFHLNGAIASTIAHDSHNIIAAGNSDFHLVKAINAVIEEEGGLSFYDENNSAVLPLEIGGLMTNKPAHVVADKYKYLENLVKLSGSKLKSPFMTLSFMALIVIPELKISDKGLFDITKLSYIPLFE